MSSISSSRGSAAVDFILSALPLLSIFVVTVTITLYAYARSVILDATIEGVRYASLADQDIESGIARTKELAHQSIGTALSIQVMGQSASLGALEANYFETSLFLPGTNSRVISVSARATSEIQQ